MIVALEHEVDVVLVEDGYPLRPERRAFALGVRGVDRVMEHHELPGGLRPREGRVEPLGLLLRRSGIGERQGAVEDGDEGVAILEGIDEVRVDPRGTVRGQVEERPVEPRPLVEVFVVADAGHERQPLEDPGCAEEEVVPVGPLVAPVDQVAGDEQERRVRMTPMGRGEQLAPLLEAALGVAHIEELERTWLRPAPVRTRYQGVQPSGEPSPRL